MKDDFITTNLLERTEREKMGKHLFNAVMGAFEIGYEAGVVDTLNKERKSK